MSTENARYQSTERYTLGWVDMRPGVPELPSWEFCECCQRETPHLDHCCIYDGMPNRDTCTLYLQRFRAFRQQPDIEYRPYDDRYVRIAK